MERRTGRLESVPMIGHVVSWAKQLSLRFGQSNELQKLDPEEINRIARDFGVSVSELLTLAKTSAGVQELLKQRLAEMGLSEELLQKKHPNEFGELNRACAVCTSTKRCAKDFLQYKPGRSEYCPNTDTLEALRVQGDANAEPSMTGRRN
ncbi:MAG: hypothetical protein Q7V17_14545 [Afipia sp.]|nr:hypothetical protein [Afipia sp.]